MKTRSIMIVGVGGQGSLLASRIIGNVLSHRALMSRGQRGTRNEPASVVTYVSTAARYARL